jgi:superfamily II DNA/RNA helicase
MTTFAQFGLPEPLVDALHARDITEPFPIQAATIADALAGRDVSGKAPTGSGKTLAFGLPLLARVAPADRHRPSSLILAPTRELAEQIKDELEPLARATRNRVLAVYGGVGYGHQKAMLRKGVDVLVATPGRLEDLIDQGDADLSRARIVVVDEADRMADMGFLPVVRRLLDRTAKDRQTLLFSATLDGDIAVLSRDYQRDPVRHEAGTVEEGAGDVRHHFWRVEHQARAQHTADVVGAMGRSIVFTRTRHGADRLARQLGKAGVDAVALHGGRSQNQRTKALRAFSAGRAAALVATDVAARGIHIDAVATVIHFDPPADHKDYLHRSGRTARAGAGGTVVSLVTRDQERSVARLQRSLGLDAPIGGPALDDLHRAGNGRESGSAKRTTDRREDGHGAGSDHSPQPGKPRGRSTATSNLYVANLPWSATERDLREVFSRHGSVEDATVVRDRRSGRSRGFGFVVMPYAAAQTAVLRRSRLGGRDLTVRIARPARSRG